MLDIGLLFVAALLAQHGKLRTLDKEPTLTVPDSTGKKKKQQEENLKRLEADLFFFYLFPVTLQHAALINKCKANTQCDRSYNH